MPSWLLRFFMEAFTTFLFSGCNFLLIMYACTKSGCKGTKKNHIFGYAVGFIYKILSLSPSDGLVIRFFLFFFFTFACKKGVVTLYFCGSCGFSVN